MLTPLLDSTVQETNWLDLTVEKKAKNVSTANIVFGEASDNYQFEILGDGLVASAWVQEYIARTVYYLIRSSDTLPFKFMETVFHIGQQINLSEIPSHTLESSHETSLSTILDRSILWLFKEITDYYIIEDENELLVLQIIRNNSELAALLLEAITKIVTHFPNSQAILEPDTDSNTDKLMVTLSVEMDPYTAYDAKNKFDNNWWLDNMDRANGALSFIVELSS